MNTKNESHITEVPLTVKINTTTKPTKKQMKELTELLSEVMELMVQSIVSKWHEEQTKQTQTKTKTTSKSKKH